MLADKIVREKWYGENKDKMVRITWHRFSFNLTFIWQPSPKNHSAMPVEARLVEQ